MHSEMLSHFTNYEIYVKENGIKLFRYTKSEYLMTQTKTACRAQRRECDTAMALPYINPWCINVFQIRWFTRGGDFPRSKGGNFSYFSINFVWDL